ncbi:MAG: 3-deoxy-7-phosphoheptulonate synthase [Acidobacteriota bacterium]|nr:3-deoxy-7-phosphoheptulonate synthase [Acidobacteriota bacterium]
MILQLKETVSPERAARLAQLTDGQLVVFRGRRLLIFPSQGPGSPLPADEDLGEVIDFHEDWPLASRKVCPEKTIIEIGGGLRIGDGSTLLIAGPCAAESEAQLRASASFLVDRGIRLFRAGLFKPRTSAYSFPGLEFEGLEVLASIRREFGLKLITEVYDTSHFDAVEEIADVIQVGSKAMFNLALLRRCGRSSKPVLLKRFFSASTREWLQAADVILAAGNPNVILGERGIRTFEPRSRFVFDLNSAVYIQENSHLPLLLDPSHAIGRASGVGALARAAAAFGADAIMVEVHPAVQEARCDRAQALDHATFAALQDELITICRAVGRELK